MAASVQSPTTTEYTRLHITPLDPNLLKAILPPAILPHARNISFHTIETFPKKAYGYIELPVMDAEKIKKKLNGSILKGSKVRIEKARPEKEVVVEKPEVEKPKKSRKESKKRKREDVDVLTGVDIGERSVKRGWTTPVAQAKGNDREIDKRKTKSKYTTGTECLFTTVVPPNLATKSKVTDNSEKPEKKRPKPGKEVVVHEFAKTTKYATFLRSTSNGKTKVSAEFLEGKGWVDEEGNVIEEVVITKLRESTTSKRKTPRPEPVVGEEDTSSNEESGDTSEEDSGDETVATTGVASATKSPLIPKSAVDDSETSSSGSSSSESESEAQDSSSISEDENDSEEVSSTKEEVPSHTVSRPVSSSGVPINLSIKIPHPEITSTPIASSDPMHPLEALYKRPKPGTLDPAPKSTVPAFSFFATDDVNSDNDEEMEEAQDVVPLTPFTQRDFEYRGLRSAAPTPDTAHASKRFLWPSSRDEDDEDDDDEAPSSPIRKGESSKSAAAKVKETKKEGTGGEEESDFQKWFYEHRGDTNRAWKKRRRVAGKEKRHRDNKKRSDRPV